MIVVGGILQIATPSQAQTVSECSVKIPIENKAEYNYSPDLGVAAISGFSGLVMSDLLMPNPANLTAAGIKDSNGTWSLGSLTGAWSDELIQLDFTPAEATKAAIAVTKAWVKLSRNPQMNQLATTARDALVAAVPTKASKIEELGGTPEQVAKVLANRVLKRMFGLAGLTTGETEQAIEQIQMDKTVDTAFPAVAQVLPAKAQAIAQTQKLWTDELANLHASKPSGISEGSVVNFGFIFANTGSGDVPFVIPNPAELQKSSLTGPGTITAIKYQLLNPTGTVIEENSVTANTNVKVPARSRAIVTVVVKVGTIPKEGGAVTVKYKNNCDNANNNFVQQTVARSPHSELTDPFGRITSCTGGFLANYQGFNVGLYEADPKDPTGGMTGVLPTTGTELPDLPNNGIPKGIEPNRENSNPFNLTNSDEGRYSFLLDERRGQLNAGRTYILLVNPPPGSQYRQRRIRLQIGQTQIQSDGRKIVNYIATALDGIPISMTDLAGKLLPPGNAQNTQMEGQIGSYVEGRQILVENAETQGLSIAVISLSTSICEEAEIQITKTGDRASAAPGDTVVYRLSIRNLSETTINNLVVTDNLPLGFQFIPESLRGAVDKTPASMTSSRNGRTVTLQATGVTLPKGGVLNVAYATLLTPDAIRGTAENSAIVNARRADNGIAVKDGPAIYRLRMRSGILSDTGTIVGRVFVDKNFDGEQQRGEPGVPNAVIIMDDGNRITTDPNGSFSVGNALPGYRTGVLDLTSLPGYTLAPNLKIKERNSQSRLVHLQPSGMVRMNFAVTPALKEGQ